MWQFGCCSFRSTSMDISRTSTFFHAFETYSNPQKYVLPQGVWSGWSYQWGGDCVSRLARSRVRLQRISCDERLWEDVQRNSRGSQEVHFGASRWKEHSAYLNEKHCFYRTLSSICLLQVVECVTNGQMTSEQLRSDMAHNHGNFCGKCVWYCCSWYFEYHEGIAFHEFFLTCGNTVSIIGCDSIIYRQLAIFVWEEFIPDLNED